MMIMTSITLPIQITEPEIIAKIEKMSPCSGLVALMKQLMVLMKAEMPEYARLKIVRAIAEDAIARGLVKVFPGHALYMHLCEATPRKCQTLTQMYQMAIAHCETEGLGRPPLKDLHALCELMIENEHTTLKPDTSSAANVFLSQIVDGSKVQRRANLQGRVFEDDVDACEALSNLAEVRTGQFPDTKHLRSVVYDLTKDGVITITDSAMMS